MTNIGYCFVYIFSLTPHSSSILKVLYLTEVKKRFKLRFRKIKPLTELLKPVRGGGKVLTQVYHVKAYAFKPFCFHNRNPYIDESCECKRLLYL